MPLSKEQLAKRRSGLGASDVSAVLGLDPYRTAYDLYAEKTGKLAEANDKNKPWLETGNLLEGPLLDWASRTLGRIIVPTSAIPDPAGTVLAANPDGLVEKTGEPVESKTSGIYGPLPEHWGDEDSDDVPQRVVVQGMVQMICTDKPVCHVPAILAGRGFIMFRLAFCQDLADIIREQATEFWMKHVLADVPPDSLPSPEIIKRIKREPNSVASVPDEVFMRARDLRLARLDAEKTEEAAFADLMKYVGTAEAGVCGEGMFTFLEQRGQPRIDKAKLEVEHPGLLEKYLVETSHRVKRFKKA